MTNYKGYIIKPHPVMPSHYICVTEGKGGKIPDILSGMFTKPSLVKEIIDKYTEEKGK